MFHQTSFKRDRTTVRKKLLGYLKILRYALAILMVMGDSMMILTAFFFHTLPEIIVGALFGMIPWCIMYKMVPWCFMFYGGRCLYDMLW